MNYKVLLILGTLLSTSALANFDSLYGGIMVSPLLKKPVELIVKLSLSDRFGKATVTTTRDLDIGDPDRHSDDQYFCVTTVKVPSGTVELTVNGGETQTTATEAYSYLKSTDDGVCAKPVFGDEAILGFTLYATGASVNFDEKKFNQRSSLVLDLSTVSHGKMLLVKNQKDGTYQISSLSFSDEPTTVQLFPTVLKSSWAHYATTKQDPRMTLQGSGSIVLNKLR